MHIRFADAQGTFDAINCYQQTFSKSVDHARAREQVWHGLAQLLGALPLRNSLLMAGDWNASLVSRPPWVGRAVSPVTSDVPDVLGDIAELHDLCALNSWQGKDAHTCVTIHGGKSCIDAVWTRRCLADPEARCTHTVPKCPLLAQVSACFHLPLSGSFPRLNQSWKHQARESRLRSGIDMDQLCMAAREQRPVWLRLIQSVQEVLDSYITMDIDAVAAQVAKLCTRAFPYNKVTRSAPCKDQKLTSLRTTNGKYGENFSSRVVLESVPSCFGGG